MINQFRLHLSQDIDPLITITVAAFPNAACFVDVLALLLCRLVNERLEVMVLRCCALCLVVCFVDG